MDIGTFPLKSDARQDPPSPSLGRRFTVPAGATILKPGEATGTVFEVISGRLRAARINADGTECPIRDYINGDLANEQALLNAPATCRLTAIRESQLLEMTPEDFATNLASNPATALASIRALLRRPAAPPPRIICILPLTPNLDAAAFATDLAAHRTALGDPASTLLHPNEAALHEALNQAERAGATLFLAVNQAAPNWSRACLAHADEILLLAAAAHPLAETAAAGAWFENAEIPRSKRTLVLLHEPAAAPNNTAAWLDLWPAQRHIHLRRGAPADLRRLTRLLAGRAVGLVLSGGGARGLAHIGVINALEESGIEIDLLGGTSLGAVIAGWRALGVQGDALREAARKSFVTNGNPIGDVNLLPLISLVRGRRVAKLIEAAVHAAMGGPIGIEDCWLNLFAVAANYSRAEEAVLRRGPFTKSLLASIALPGIMPPVAIGGQLYVDGSTINNLPIDVMRQSGAGHIIAVDLLADSSRAFNAETLPATLIGTLRGVFHKDRRKQIPNIIAMLLKASILNSTHRQRAQRAEADVVITPALHGIRLLDFKKFDKIVAAGAAAAHRHLATLPPETLAALRSAN